MAILIEITKILEKENVGFYHVFTKHGGETEFYVRFDKKLHKIYCFLTNNFSKPVRTVDPNDPHEIIGGIPGINVNASILAKVFRTAEKAFELNEFPQCMDYCAWEKVASKIFEAHSNAIKNGIELTLNKEGKYFIESLTNEGIKIAMHITQKGRIKTVFPVLK